MILNHFFLLRALNLEVFAAKFDITHGTHHQKPPSGYSWKTTVCGDFVLRVLWTWYIVTDAAVSPSHTPLVASGETEFGLYHETQS